MPDDLKDQSARTADPRTVEGQKPAAEKPGLELPAVAAEARRPAAAAERPAKGTRPAAPLAQALEPTAIQAAKSEPARSTPTAAAGKPVDSRVEPAPRKSKSAQAAVGRDKPRAKPAAKPLAKSQAISQAKSQVMQRTKTAAGHHAAAPESAPKPVVPDVAVLGRDGLEACAECGTRAAKGFETLSKEVLTFGRSTLDANVAQAKALMAARSLDEALALQSEFAGAQFGALIGEATKLSRLTASLTQDAWAPLKVQAQAATRRFSPSKAA